MMPGLRRHERRTALEPFGSSVVREQLLRSSAVLTSRVATAAVLALPGIVLAALGVAHPAELTQHSADSWYALHLILLPLFPLLGLALLPLVRPLNRPVGLVVTLLVYVYAVYYSALDLLAGVATGAVMRREAGRPGAVDALFNTGNQLATYGVWAFLLACLVVAGDLVWRHRLRAAAPAVLLVAASVSLLDSHIYRWRGVATVLVIGLATGWLALLDRERAASGAPRPPG